MSISFGLPPLFLIPGLILAAFLAYWVYTNTVPSLPTPKRIFLTALRFGSLCIVLFLLFEPILRSITQTERPPVLAVLIDDSQSLSLNTSDSIDSLNSSGSFMTNLMNDFPEGDIPGILKYYRFSNETVALPQSRSSLADSLFYAGERTNMSQALDFVRDQLSDENLQGVLVLSDGQYNTGRNPIYLAERYPVPIHTVVIGDTTRKRDLQIRRVTTNDMAYVDDTLPIQVGLLSEDFSGERVTVSLFENGVPLQSSTVDLPPGTVEIPVELQHTPEEPGLRRYSVSVTQLQGEATTRNNAQSFVVRVLENKKRILLLAAAPEPDVAALRQVLRQDKNLDVDPYIQKGAGAFYTPVPLDSLDTYDAVILMGYPGRTADPQFARRIAAQIQEGLPALFMLSRQTDLRMLKDMYADVSPVQPTVIRPNFVESVFSPTPNGLQHPIFQIPELTPSIWNVLPPMIANDSRWQVSASAQVLATQVIRGIQIDEPLLVIQKRNTLRTAALLGSGTWRWKNLPEDLESASTVWVTLLTNTLQWITALEDDRPVRVAPVEDLFSGDAPIQFTGQVYDESLNPVDGASVEVQVLAGDSVQYPYTMKPVGNGRYIADIGALPEGTYQYRARAIKNDIELGADEGSFAVGSLTLEYQETRADGRLMNTLAQRSGGTSFSVTNLSQIPSFLQQSDSFRSTFFEDRVETELWQRHFFLIVIILLLTTEWFFRKRSGMV